MYFPALFWTWSNKLFPRGTINKGRDQGMDIFLKAFNNSNEDMKVKFIYNKPINLNNLLKSLNIFN